jgi:hypothetical protein
MAVPAHVRNDAHPLDELGWVPSLEHWAKVHVDKINGFARFPIFPTLGLNASINGLAPITVFWDTDQYDGTNPSITLSTSIGLAEYTNANFFSDDTIASPFAQHQFPFPLVNLYNYYNCDDLAPAGSFATKRSYLSRTPCNTVPFDHFLAISALEDPDQPDPANPQLVLDNNVHEDYARQLIPRAVGYSAGLLDYFFRGQLDVTPAQGGLNVKNMSDGVRLPR